MDFLHVIQINIPIIQVLNIMVLYEIIFIFEGEDQEVRVDRKVMGVIVILCESVIIVIVVSVDREVMREIEK
jgi:hypothetical protein